MTLKQALYEAANHALDAVASGASDAQPVERTEQDARIDDLFALIDQIPGDLERENG